MNIDRLLKIEEIDTGDETIARIEGILTLVEIIDELQTTDILYKLSAIAYDILNRLTSKANSIKLLEVEDTEVDDHFSEEEKGFLYGCYLMAATPKELVKS